MKLLWERLENWLKDHAPEILDDLNPGASESELLALETNMGFNLPDVLKESLRIHNGQSGKSKWLVAGWELLSTKRVLEEWEVWKDLYDSESFIDYDVEPQEGIADTWWQPAWIPLTYNGCGDHHCLDLAPANRGENGQHLNQTMQNMFLKVATSSLMQLKIKLPRNDLISSRKLVYSQDFIL